jgi:hypothetical protein
MQRLLRKLIVLGAAALLAANASAFSLMGPFASWQTAAIGYNLPGDVGGPMNLFEDYRITVPVLTYGYDTTFLNFFGSNGVVAVEAAMTILNAVPAASAMSDSLIEFPIQTVLGNPNATARSLKVLDLKSAVLSTVLGQMGLASPERWVYTLRDRVVIGGATNYTVIQRNFDPITWRISSIVNTVLYTYTVRDPVSTALAFADATETLPNGSIPRSPFRSVASLSDIGGLGHGEFVAGGLTQDDYGGLRYLLRFNNVNVENLTTGAGSVRLANTYSPYAPALGTNVNTNVAVAIARRPGIDKVTFSPIPIDSLLGVAIRLVTNRYVDTYYHPTNFYLTNQTVERVTSLPDILFTAGDLTVVQGVPILMSRPTSSRWVNNSALNTSGSGAGILSGPGVIPAATSNTTALVIELSTLGPSFGNIDSATARFLNERDAIINGLRNSVWGYFDANTVYSVFPDGLTLRDLERQLYGP